jgi:serine protease inhibitor
VVIDHPFLFVIRDLTSGAIIFTAQVTDPTASS